VISGEAERDEDRDMSSLISSSSSSARSKGGGEAGRGGRRGATYDHLPQRSVLYLDAR
jgi:hypothetical protein